MLYSSFPLAGTGRRLLSLAILLFAAVCCHAAEPPPDGASIFKEKCVSCHGPDGKGQANGPPPLGGDRSLRELTERVQRTMPEGAPEECVGPEAEQVASWLYAEFYSPLAQARREPARIELLHLSVPQHEQALADLIGSFRKSPPPGTDRGLRGQYYPAKELRKKPIIERRDNVVDFQFGAGLPPGYPEPVQKKEEEKSEEEKKKDPRDDLEYSIRWNGSVFAPVTGDYEFVVESENPVQLSLNGSQPPLIDGWTRSNNQTEHHGHLRLLGGRWYPLELRFSRGREAAGSVRLKWKPPGHVVELIPQSRLSPHEPQPTFVLTAPLPPDDRSRGYERGAIVSREWEEATATASLEAVAFLLERHPPVDRSQRNDPQSTERCRKFCETFASRAFRRPLTEEDRQLYLDRQFAEASDNESALKRSLLLTLMSPQFLYRETAGGFDANGVASWLSFTLWDSLPDEPLCKAARQGKLESVEQIGQQVDRMLQDPRCRDKLKRFLHVWLKLDHEKEIVRDPESFPEFTPLVVSDLRHSLDQFLNDILDSPEGSWSQLLLTSEVYVNGALAPLYGVDLPPEAPFAKVQLPGGPRSGVITHPLLMSALSYSKTTSPIHRGVFLARNVLGRRLRPPPDAFAPLPPESHRDLNTRERVTLQTEPSACQGCHSLINPLGFSLEHFDPLGRYRDQELERPIDSSGTYTDRAGENVPFSDARQLAEYLAGSREAQEAFVEKLFEHLVQQPIRAFGDDALSQLTDSFVSSGGRLRPLVREIAILSTVRARQQLAPPPASQPPG